MLFFAYQTIPAKLTGLFQHCINILLHSINSYPSPPCTPCSYEIMCNCWSEDPGDRWTFAQLRSKFDAMLSERNPYYFDLNHVNSQRPYYNNLSEQSHSDGNHTNSLSGEELEVSSY